MTQRDKVELQRLYDGFISEFKCNGDCSKCKYSIELGSLNAQEFGNLNMHGCPVYTVLEMIVEWCKYGKV